MGTSDGQDVVCSFQPTGQHIYPRTARAHIGAATFLLSGIGARPGDHRRTAQADGRRTLTNLHLPDVKAGGDAGFTKLGTLTAVLTSNARLGCR
jgi:hypothetical protein